jgi:hypothetical protein
MLKNSLSEDQRKALKRLHEELLQRSSQIQEPKPSETHDLFFDGKCTREYSELNKWYNEERRKIIEAID